MNRSASRARLLLVIVALLFALPASSQGRRTTTQDALAKSCRPVVEAKGFVSPEGKQVSLADYTAGRPLAVVVIKGEWCPACRTQLKSLSDKLERIRKLGGAVVGLSTEDAGTNRMIMKKLDLAFPILGEPSARLLERLGFWMPRMGHPLPGLLFLDPCGDLAAHYPGRRPGVNQDRLVLDTLLKLVKTGGRCGERA